MISVNVVVFILYLSNGKSKAENCIRNNVERYRTFLFTRSTVYNSNNISSFVTTIGLWMIGMLAIFLQVAQVFIDSGFTNALIQKKDRTEEDFATVFYFNILVAVLFYGILLFFGFFDCRLL